MRDSGSRTWFLAVLVAVGAFAGACSSRPTVLFEATGRDPVQIGGLDICDDFTCRSQVLDPSRPATILVHGCNASSARFAALREVFTAHGQQALCFTYNDRATLRRSAGQLRRTLSHLGRHLPNQPMTLLGHSQGGLVARLAVSSSPTDDPWRPPVDHLRLVTVSSPFNGIAAASHCGFTAVHVLSLGLTAGLCHSITGAKWFEIHPRAATVVAPPALLDEVVEHIMVVTDEDGSCRRRDRAGQCVEDDFVFSVDEQLNPRLNGERITTVTVKAGHAAIVGDDHRPPHELLALLTEHRVLEPLDPARGAEVQELLARLF